MPYYLGVDGGGTKTEALLCDQKGVIVGRGAAGASNPLFTGFEHAVKSVVKAVGDACAKLPDGGSIVHAAVCVPGMRKHAEELREALKPYCGNIFITGDELNAYFGAVAKPRGIVVVSGTGSFAMGINSRGESCEMGGWGPLLGDEGSGCYIGINCIKAVISEYEGAGQTTLLTGKIMKEFGIKEINELKRVFYADGFDRARVSALSLYVQEAAEAGDAAALAIIDDAAKQLAVLTDRVVRRLGMYDCSYDAVLTGGAAKFGKLIELPFAGYVKRSNPHLCVRKPAFGPAEGALLLALSRQGIDIENEELLCNIKMGDIKNCEKDVE